MPRSMGPRIRLVQIARPRCAKRPVTAYKSDGKLTMPRVDSGRRCCDFGDRAASRIIHRTASPGSACLGLWEEREMLTGKGRRRQQEGWQDKASASLAGPMALSCCLHIDFWVLAGSVRGQRAAWSDIYFNEFNALSCHAAPQSGCTLRFGLSLYARLR